MRIKTNYIDRELHYSTTIDNWAGEIPIDNWCLILISNTDNNQEIDEIISKSISNHVAYICGIGSKHDYIHDQADSEFVIRDMEESKYKKPKYFLMTVGDEKLDEGLWFGLNLTFHGDTEINKIHIIDTDCKWLTEIEQLIIKFKDEYLPDEE